MNASERIDSERRRLIQRLIRKLTSGEFAGLAEDYLTTASKYTGLHPKVLKELDSNDVFETWLQPLDRAVIYNKLVYFYTARGKIPNTQELFSALHGEIPPFIDIGSFRKILVKMDFVWKKTSTNSAVIIENPLVRFEKYNYLKRIQFHRQINSDIYYIDSNSYEPSGRFMDYKVTKELSKQNICTALHRVIYALGPNGITALEDIATFSNEVVENWVRDSLLPLIQKPSVFILKNYEYHNAKLLETPTLDTLKTDNIRWLDKHGVTYDPKMSKYELFALAEKYTNLNALMFRIDEMLKVRGHTVLRIPRCIENATSAALLYRVIKEMLPLTFEELPIILDNTDEHVQLFQNLITDYAATYIEEFEIFTAKQEKDMLEVEDKVDQVYDGLILKATNVKQKETCTDSDLPSCSDSE